MVKIGCDIGGVIRNTVDDGRPIAGAIEGVRELHKRSQVVFISKCGPTFRKAVLEFLKAHGLDDIPIQFCDDDNEKAGIGAKCGVTHMIDDTMPVLRSFDPRVIKIWFNPDEKKIKGLQLREPHVLRTASSAPGMS